MYGKPDCKRRRDNQADRKGKHRALMVPKRRLVGGFRLFVEQRCNEQHKEQFRVECNSNLRGGEQCDEKAQANLYER